MRPIAAASVVVLLLSLVACSGDAWLRITGRHDAGVEHGDPPQPQAPLTPAQDD